MAVGQADVDESIVQGEGDGSDFVLFYSMSETQKSSLGADLPSSNA